MATRQQLRKRWETAEGRQKIEILYGAFRSNTPSNMTLEQLHTLIDPLPYTEEVAPNLDMRGLQLDKSIFVRNLDLPGVRLDYSALRGNLSDGDWKNAVFDGADVTQIDFELNLTGASFIKANAKKVWFTQSVLSEADFSEAKLTGAYLKEVPCNGTNFSGADMRSASCVGTDFRGANLSGANLTGAALGSVLFDEHTKVQDTNFTDTALDTEFAAFIAKGGAQAKSDEVSPDFEVAVFDATIVLLQELNKDGSLASLLTTATTIRQRLKNDAEYEWEPVIDGLPDSLQAIFYKTYEEGMGQAEYYM